MAAKQRRIETGWRTYAEHVLPAGAPSVQTQETRRAFYAGAWHMLNLLAELGEDSVSEDAGVDVLEALTAEARQFSKDVEEGRA